MSAIDRELLVMRGFAASRGDDDAIDEAQRDVELMRVQIAALEAKVATLQSLSDEYAERVTKEIAAAKLLRAALEALLTTKVEYEAAGTCQYISAYGTRAIDAISAYTAAWTAARKALEATK